MNTKNKILKVLEKVPSGTKLYSAAFGNLELEFIIETFGNKRIKLMEDNKDRRVYLPDGRYRKGGEVTLYPSKEMRDWDKFAWKKGDVLTNNKGAFCIFKEFSGYPYTNFVATFVHIAGVSTSDSTVEVTQEWYKASGENAGKYIKLINTNLEKENKRLNLKTGDILTCLDAAFHASSTFIFEREYEYGYSYYAGIEISGKLYISPGSIWCGKCGNIRYATSEEKTKLFDALTKEGKRWNAENKIFEDIKPVSKKANATYKKESDISEHKFKPFEKVLCRDYKDSVWDVDFFGFKVKNETETSFIYRCVGNIYKYCIPYKGNEHLLGTSKDPEEK
jgi:hypothetical protein